MLERVLIQVKDLGMVRGVRKLFSGIDFRVCAGQLLVLRGANGSGKTTLLRILAGLTRPLAGTVELHTPHHWVGHLNGQKPFETVESHLNHWKKVWGGDGIDRSVEAFEMGNFQSVRVGLLSAGQKRRLALARMLLVDRNIWLLDEPFAALDNEARQVLRNLIEERRLNGGCVVIAMHDILDLQPTFELSL